ncbi:MAG: hypothetical protein COW00_09835 [Bdellovibrio sp. CG12_big_fil_rev_8_21_14_0_65_39_13]|nr:MAG: hypothetical protein COW78_15860 [Bdellovibrio sp. CG22_combo_CG10-13_8_21_14_all_39_27]PIQ59600.1 MAG: hypothetical protein COW00_09835 [Bdellovibrio sp. CG12_big_fil_rev_8_21_14_0_65_39_13]PIR33164.1 MAG: hypothetical protein COV37_17110 [Bdellovibrio sp. CG11_big_fil_rev_8_21_14_0_20_39_38]
MQLQSLLIILLGSVFHLGWNILTKKGRDQLLFLWLALVIPGLFGFFFLLFERYSQTTHLFIFATSIIHSLYFFLLANAYHYADLSFVYPYCRGIGTIVATIGGILFLGESPSVLGWTGISLALSGTLIEPILSLKSKRNALQKKGILFTLFTGIMIGSYLVLDTRGIRTLERSVDYVAIMFFYSSLMLAPFVFRFERIKNEWKHSGMKPFLGSAFMAGAYAIILLAMQTTPVSYTVSARASGIILSALYGKFVFKEIVGINRVIAIVFILVGVVCLAYA